MLNGFFALSSFSFRREDSALVLDKSVSIKYLGSTGSLIDLLILGAELNGTRR